MPLIAAAFQPWKTAAFSATAICVGGLVERLEIGVLGAAVGVGQLGAGDRERRAQLDQRQDLALRAR